MIPAKNYKTVTEFVTVMPRILWPLFSRTVHGIVRIHRVSKKTVPVLFFE